MLRRVSPCVAVVAVMACVACAGNPPPVDPATLPPNTLTAQESRTGWRLLFDGVSTAGWHLYTEPGHSEGWLVDDGMLIGTGTTRDLMTDRQYDSFELQLEWKVKPAGNSGVFFWAHEASEEVYQNAPEIQVLDNAGYPDLTPLHAAGALYDLEGADLALARPAGEWNTLFIETNRSRVKVWFNGVMVHDVDFDSDAMKAKIAASKFKEYITFGRTRRGYIGLQSHGDSVWYRNLKIRERG